MLLENNRYPYGFDGGQSFRHLEYLVELKNILKVGDRSKKDHFPLVHPNRPIYDQYRDLLHQGLINPEMLVLVGTTLSRSECWATEGEYQYIHGNSFESNAASVYMSRVNKASEVVDIGYRFVTMGNVGPNKRPILKQFPSRLITLYDTKYMLVPTGEHPDKYPGFADSQFIPDPRNNQEFIDAATRLVWHDKNDPRSKCRSLLSFDEKLVLQLIYLSPTKLSNSKLKQITASIYGYSIIGSESNSMEVRLSTLRSKLRAYNLPIPEAILSARYR